MLHRIRVLHLVGSVGHIVHSGVSGAQNVGTLFFRLRWAWCSFQKKHVGTRYAELMFLYSVGSVGHIVHSYVSGHETTMNYFSSLGGPGAVSIKSMLGHITPNLWFCIWWDLQVMYSIVVHPVQFA
jgi:hypothetical protein